MKWKAFTQWRLIVSVVALLIFAFATRVYRVNYPTSYYFDEVYHGATAKLMSRGDIRAYEWWNPAPEPDTAVDWLHPPFAKLTQAASMLIFGENSFGWRFSSVVFGTLLIGLVYWLGRELGFSHGTSFLAAALLSFDGLALTMSRIAMNDIHVTSFMILTLVLYWRWRKMHTPWRAILVALAAGLSVASKWSGVFVVGIIGAHQILEIAWNSFHCLPQNWRARNILLLCLVWLIPGVYLSGYEQMFYLGHDWAHMRELNNQIWWYQTHLDATHPYQSTPLQWMLNLRPVYAFTNSQLGQMQDIYLFGNPILFWTGIIAIVWTGSDAVNFALRYSKKILNALSESIVKTSADSLALTIPHLESLQKIAPKIHVSAFLLLAYLIPWTPWIFSPRIMFFYHYLPAVPILCLILASQLTDLAYTKVGKIIAVTTVILIGAAFLLFFPHLTALPVSESVFAPWYYAIKTWR